MFMFIFSIMFTLLSKYLKTLSNIELSIDCETDTESKTVKYWSIIGL